MLKCKDNAIVENKTCKCGNISVDAKEGDHCAVDGQLNYMITPKCAELGAGICTVSGDKCTIAGTGCVCNNIIAAAG